MNRSWILLALLADLAAAQTPPVMPGCEILRERGFDILQGKRVGLITNPTGVDAHLRSTIDILHEAKGVTLVALFGPEHGVRGDHSAGSHVESYMDPRTNVPVYSLYGKTTKPTPEMLKDIDLLVYDIQDIGCRSYTYVSTLGLAMAAAAEHHIPFVVLDRPNPLGGIRVEGIPVQKGFESFIGQFPIPYVYGLTCGELARLLNEESMLPQGVRCSLTVVPMKGWKREMTFGETGLPWVPPSPHIPTESSPLFYVSTGILGELGVVSEGVGYTIPFHTLAAEWINAESLATAMNSLNTPGVLYRPISFVPYYGKNTGKTLHGVHIYIDGSSCVSLMSVQFLFLQVHHELYPGRNPFSIADSQRVKSFDRAVGTDQVRKMFVGRMKYNDIREYLESGVDDFRERSKKYFLY